MFAEQEAKIQAEITKRVGIYTGQGMTPAAARARAEQEMQQLAVMLQNATPEQRANFEKFTGAVANNEAAAAGAAAAKAQQEAAAAAARKLETDTMKNVSQIRNARLPTSHFNQPFRRF